MGSFQSLWVNDDVSDRVISYAGYRHSPEYNLKTLYEKKYTKSAAIEAIAKAGFHMGPYMYLFDKDSKCQHKDHSIKNYSFYDKYASFNTRVTKCINCNEILDVCQFLA